MKQPSTLRPDAMPFAYHRGQVGVLLTHGYSGSPGELHAMGAALAEHGYSSYGPLLAGHGSLPEAMHQVVWREWLQSALAGLAELRRTCSCSTIVLGGFSMGGLVSIAIAARLRVDGVILMAPALRLHGQPFLALTDVAARVKPWYYPLANADFSSPAVRAAVLGYMPDADLDDPETIAMIRSNSRVPIGSLYELVRIQRRARRDLPHVTVPALVMQGRLDRTVDPRAAEVVYRLLGSTDKTMRWFENSDHQLTREAEQAAVFDAAADWLDQRFG